MGTSRAEKDEENLDSVTTLELLTAVAENGTTSQRSLAGRLGIAVGLANLYVKRCVRKGLIKISQAPARRYAYYLTPAGFVEKSRLTIDFLSTSFGFFRRARSEVEAVLRETQERGWQHVALFGTGELAEVAVIASLDLEIPLVAAIDDSRNDARFAGLPVWRQHSLPPEPTLDGVVITDIRNPQASYDQAVALFGPERVLAPTLLRLTLQSEEQPPLALGA